jgi:hypothetical protein
VIWKGPKVTVVVDSPLPREALVEELRAWLLTRRDPGFPFVRGVMGRVDEGGIRVFPMVPLAGFNVEFDGAAVEWEGGSRLCGTIGEARYSRRSRGCLIAYFVFLALFFIPWLQAGLWYAALPFYALMAVIFGGYRYLFRRYVLKHKVPELMQYILERAQGTLVEGPSPNVPGES